MRRSLLLAAALVLGGVPAALAAGWSPWAAAFPPLPCPDGWAACRVGPQDLNGATVRDAAGLPLAADARLGWFDLEPTAVFSPFVGLSGYGGVSAAAAATMAEAPAVAAPPEVVAVAAPVATPSPTPPVVTPTAAPPVASPTATPARPPVVAPTSTPPVSTRPTPVSTPPSTSPPSTVVEVPPGPPVATAVPPKVVTPPVATATPVEAVIVPVATAPSGCTDLVALEPLAMVGGLGADTLKCLERRIDAESVQTTRDKASRVLIFNAEARGDRGEWSRLVQRHLEDIDRSDPDLCFKYALELSRNGRSLGVIRWADVALENKHRWQGATYKKRVFDLHRLKAQAANALWTAAEKEYATGEHTEENRAKAEKYRAMTKDYALEWLDYAKASQQDGATALALCVSAAGNRTFCEGG